MTYFTFRMNKYTTKLSKAAFGLALALVIASCNQNSSPTSTTANDSTNVANATSNKQMDKIVYVNSDTLSEKFVYFKDIRDRLEAKAKKAQNDLQSKGQAFQREVAEAEQKLATMSASERQAVEERLARKQQELAQLNQNASASLAQDENTEVTAVYNTISEYLKKHAEEKGYQFVLTYSKTNPSVIYADPTLDITKEVVEGLNKDYANNKSAKK